MKKILFSILSLTLALGIMIPLSVPAFACPTSPGSRWTGGGSFFTADGTRVTHGFEIYAVTPIVDPDNLEVNWEGNHFHMTALTSVFSYYDASLAGPQLPPKSVDNVLTGFGTGRYTESKRLQLILLSPIRESLALMTRYA